MSHANAALTPRTRLRLARLIVDQGWPVLTVTENSWWADSCVSGMPELLAVAVNQRYSMAQVIDEPL